MRMCDYQVVPQGRLLRTLAKKYKRNASWWWLKERGDISKSVFAWPFSKLVIAKASEKEENVDFSIQIQTYFTQKHCTQ